MTSTGRKVGKRKTVALVIGEAKPAKANVVKEVKLRSPKRAVRKLPRGIQHAKRPTDDGTRRGRTPRKRRAYEGLLFARVVRELPVVVNARNARALVGAVPGGWSRTRSHVLQLLVDCKRAESPEALWLEIEAAANRDPEAVAPVLMAALSQKTHPQNGGKLNKQFEVEWPLLLGLLGRLRYEPAVEYIRDFMSLPMNEFELDGHAAAALAFNGTPLALSLLVEEWHQWGGFGDVALDVEETLLDLGEKVVPYLIDIAEEFDAGLRSSSGVQEAIPEKVIELLARMGRRHRALRPELRSAFANVRSGRWRTDWEPEEADKRWIASLVRRGTHAGRLSAKRPAGR